MKHVILATVSASAYSDMDEHTRDDYARFLLEASLAGQGYTIAGGVTARWEELTQQDYDVALSMYREQEPGVRWPGFDVGDYRVHAYAETDRDE